MTTPSLELNNEEWRPVVGREGLYEVSNRGFVRSLNFRRKKMAQVIRFSVTPVGYHYVYLGKGKMRSIHRIVMESFSGPCPDGMEVNHKDRNKANNHVSNLEYVTKSENQRHSYVTGRMRPTGGLHPKAKISENTAREIKSLFLFGATKKEICTHFGLSYDMVRGVTDNRTWCHIANTEAGGVF